jgi:hypothetical protein
MYMRFRNLTIFGLLIVLTVAMPSVKAEPVDVHHILNRSVGSYFEMESGCIGTSVRVSAVDYYKESPPLPQQPASRLYVRIGSANNCTGELIISVFEDLPLPDGALKISGRQAELSATVPVLNTLTQTVSEVSIDLKWTANGEPRIVEREVTRSEGETYKTITVRSLIRIPAVAVGTVVFDGENRTPDPSVDAQIDKNTLRWMLKGELPEE